jgi:methyl-accepting chemotaxis protein
MKNLSLKFKIASIAFIILVAFVLMTTLYVIPTMNNAIDDQVELKLRELVEVPISIIEFYYQEAESGMLSEDEARLQALRAIEAMRYDDESNYYFVLDYDVNIVMHPIKPALNGQYMAESKDEDGNPLFQDMVDVVLEKDEGVVDYVWEKPGETEVQPKSSFVVGFKPWELIVGTGVYVDDVEAIKATVTRNVIGLFALISIFALLIVLYIVLRINKAVGKIMVVSKKVSENDYSSTIKLNQNDELGKIAKSFDHAIENVRDLVNEINSSIEVVSKNSSILDNNTDILENSVETTSDETHNVSASIEETATSAQNINNMIDEIKFAVESVASRATEGATTTADVTLRATDLKEDAVISSDKANKIYDEVKIVMEDAIEKSKAVEQINILSSAILDITNQTNLLALNASIEAARAGEAGRGFAVVADEISKLAEQSSQAVSRIQSVVEEVNGSVLNLTDASKKILDFVDSEVKDDYKKLVSVSEQYNDDASTFNGIMMDLSATSEELHASMDSIAEITEEMTDALNQGASSVSSISDLVGDILIKTKELNNLNDENVESVQHLVATKDKIKL